VIPVAPDFAPVVTVALGENKSPTTPLEATFEEAAKDLVKTDPKAMAQKYPEATHWVLSQKDRPHRPL
jgi:hypothetical protein